MSSWVAGWLFITCLFGCLALPACLSAGLSVCLLAHLSSCLSVCIPYCLCLPACLSFYNRSQIDSTDASSLSAVSQTGSPSSSSSPVSTPVWCCSEAHICLSGVQTSLLSEKEMPGPGVCSGLVPRASSLCRERKESGRGRRLWLCSGRW